MSDEFFINWEEVKKAQRKQEERDRLLRNATSVSQYQRQRIDKDGYVITENWVNVSDGQGNSESFKEPQLFIESLDGNYFKDPDFEKYERMRKRLSQD